MGKPRRVTSHRHGGTVMFDLEPYLTDGARQGQPDNIHGYDQMG
jgi:hypothetical protein